MSADPKKPSQPKAAEVCKHVPLDRPIRKLLRDGMTAFEFIEMLEKEGHFSDAVRVVAFMLPVRESVWWACQCARQAPLADAPPEVESALQAAEKWVAEMTEEARVVAGTAGAEVELSTAAGLAAMAAFSSGGNIAPADAPRPIAAPPDLAAQYVSGSILVSALLPKPIEAPGKYRTFLRQGLDLYKSIATPPER
jgi:uncharacterized protein DUF6931